MYNTGKTLVLYIHFDDMTNKLNRAEVAVSQSNMSSHTSRCKPLNWKKESENKVEIWWKLQKEKNTTFYFRLILCDFVPLNTYVK